MDGRILVTGSSGTIGTRLCERLLNRGDDVVGIDRRENRWLPEVENQTHRLDLLNHEEIEDAGIDTEAIVHLAANARVYELVKDPNLAKENIDTVYNTLEYARKNDVDRFIFAGSREIYGNTGGVEHSEGDESIRDCESPYTASKISGESLLQAYRECYGIEISIVRYSNVYGMYDASDRVIPLFIKQTLDGEDLVVYGEDKCLDFTYIDDAVQGTLKILDNWETAKGEVFNIASGDAASLVQVANIIQKELEADNEIKLEGNRTGEVVKFVADIAKATERLGFNPETDIEKGISLTVDWYTSTLYN